jgi:hypothetical protein
MLNTGSGTHDLDIALLNHGFVTHTVTVFEIAAQRNGNDFHVVVRVGAKAHAGCHRIIVEHTKGAEMNTGRFIITPKAEGMIAVQPAVIGMSLVPAL